MIRIEEVTQTYRKKELTNSVISAFKRHPEIWMSFFVYILNYSMKIYIYTFYKLSLYKYATNYG